MIKKMISAAALIAAGTALASADTGWTTVQLTSTEVPSANSSLSELGVTETYNYASYSWCVSFTLDITNENTGLAVFTTADDGLEILINTSNGALNIARDGNHLSDPDSTGSTPAFETVADGGSSNLELSLSWDAESQKMTLSATQETGISGTYTTVLDMSETGTRSDLIEYASLTPDSTFWTNSALQQGVEATPISNIAIYVRSESNVPEPSMFGVLAGLGALGLVATRRRRNRKA